MRSCAAVMAEHQINVVKSFFMEDIHGGRRVALDSSGSGFVGHADTALSEKGDNDEQTGRV